MTADALEALAAELRRTAEAVDQALVDFVPRHPEPAAHVTEAMLHSLRGGKRIRPFLVRLSAETFGLDPDAVMPTACAFELLHTATLIHDDLPAIDNADLRRGQPSCHVAFDEPTAILAGDALIAAAFGALARQAERPETPPERVVRVVGEFADAVGAVIAGEAADIRGEDLPPDAQLLDYIHTHKTAALFVGAVRAGAILAGADASGLKAVTDYGRAIGLLFQITDDLLDVEGSEEETGKPTGADAAAGKQTYPGVYGVEEARRRAAELASQAQQAAGEMPRRAETWAALAQMLLTRTR